MVCILTNVAKTKVIRLATSGPGITTAAAIRLKIGEEEIEEKGYKINFVEYGCMTDSI